MTGFAVSLRPGLVESRLPTDYVSMAKVSRAVPACTTLSAAEECVRPARRRCIFMQADTRSLH